MFPGTLSCASWHHLRYAPLRSFVLALVYLTITGEVHVFVHTDRACGGRRIPGMLTKMPTRSPKFPGLIPPSPSLQMPFFTGGCAQSALGNHQNDYVLCKKIALRRIQVALAEGCALCLQRCRGEVMEFFVVSIIFLGALVYYFYM